MACPKLALDVPSGLDSDSGRIRGCAVRADHTLTFLGLKPGLLTADGPDYAGELHLDTLGVDPAALPATTGIAPDAAGEPAIACPRAHATATRASTATSASSAATPAWWAPA